MSWISGAKGQLENYIVFPFDSWELMLEERVYLGGQLRLFCLRKFRPCSKGGGLGFQRYFYPGIPAGSSASVGRVG